MSIKLLDKTSPDDILETALESAIQISGMDCGGIYLLDEELKKLKLVITKGLSDEFVKNIISYDYDSENTKLVLAGEPVYSVHPIFANPLLTSENLKAIAVIPIKLTKNKIIGCINISSHTLNEVPFYSREALETLVRNAGIAIARAYSDAELAKNEERYRLLVENSPIVTWTANEKGHLKFISSNCENILGYTQKELYEMDTWAKIIHTTDSQIMNDTYFKLITEKKPYEIDFKVQKKNGTWIWIHTKAKILKEDNKTILTSGTFSDITNLKEIEIDLKKERDKAKIILILQG
ncbi:MAG: PAS domain S-box protein [Bacteroidales bacterium]|nr:PAS domain S-box protein [Bacteroidales bacterium]